MIAIVDYGVGNLFSLKSSLGFIGAEAVVTGDPEVIRSADRIILPGVGAFGDAAEKLRASGLAEVVTDEARKGKKILGICLGMQLLFERSLEYGEHKGLGLLPGSVISMEGVIPEKLMIPHIGWNALIFKRSHPVFKYLKDGDHVYFVHSYFATETGESLVATAEYGEELCAAAGLGNVFGTQFHPEKSGEVGMRILKAFCEW